MDIRHYTIALDVNFEQESINGYTTVDLITAQPTHVLLFDLLDSLNVSQVLVNGKKEPFVYKDNSIRITTNDELPAARLHPTGTLWIFGDAAAVGAVS